ncbi:MAG TPA: aminotransferase class IV, partial [Chthoniobacterales bacterium]
MAATVNVNGRISAGDEAVIPVFDHGFLYGEGIYETLRTYHGRLFLYERHLRRLRNSARLIDLALNFTDDELAVRIRDTMAAASLDGSEAYVRVLVTRGVGDLTYDLKATPTPSWVIIVKPLVAPPPEIYKRGVKVVLVDVVRNHPQSVNPMIKSNNLMNSALAAQEAFKLGGFEAVMRNYRGELTECTQSNLFIVKNGTALAPPLESGLLPGITREFVFEIGRAAGIEVREQILRDDDLFGADEA